MRAASRRQARPGGGLRVRDRVLAVHQQRAEVAQPQRPLVGERRPFECGLRGACGLRPRGGPASEWASGACRRSASARLPSADRRVASAAGHRGGLAQDRQARSRSAGCARHQEPGLVGLAPGWPASGGVRPARRPPHQGIRSRCPATPGHRRPRDGRGTPHQVGQQAAETGPRELPASRRRPRGPRSPPAAAPAARTGPTARAGPRPVGAAWTRLGPRRASRVLARPSASRAASRSAGSPNARTGRQHGAEPRVELRQRRVVQARRLRGLGQQAAARSRVALSPPRWKLPSIAAARSAANAARPGRGP